VSTILLSYTLSGKGKGRIVRMLFFNEHHALKVY